MERRFVLFLVLTCLLWAGYILIKVYFGPKPQPAAVAQNDAPAGQQNPPEKPPEKPPENNPPAAKPPEVAVPAPAVPHKQGTLGSLDQQSRYKMLVTWNSRGAAIERVELNSYWDVADVSGYLGHLAPSADASGGAVVNVVGAGTPAARATPDDPSLGIGLKPGDVVTGIDKLSVSSFADLDPALTTLTRPNQQVPVTVQRKGVARPIVFTVAMTRRPLQLVQPEDHDFTQPDGSKKHEDFDPLSLLTTLDTVGPRSIRAGASEIGGLPSLLNGDWEIDSTGEDFVQFSYTLDEGAMQAIGQTGKLKLLKRYTIAAAEKPGEAAYHVNLRFEIQNLGTEQTTVAYRLQGPTGLPLEGWWYSTKLHPEMFRGAGARDVVWSVARSHHLLGNPMIVSDAKAAIKENKPPTHNLLNGDEAVAFDYAGVDTQFFASAILPQPSQQGESIKFRRAEAMPVQDVMSIPKNRLRTTDVSVLLASDLAKLDAGKSLTHEYKVFFGPKDPHVLDHKDYDLGALIEFGWPIFRFPAQMLQGVLWYLHYVTQNYGIAIILLTVIVRSCMLPVSLKQAKSAAVMQQLAPEIQKIKDKHPDDAVKQHAAVQELYKKHSFNPFGGCLLVFIQLPIFIGLYRCLSVDIDLRDAALFPGLSWASNLAGPDKLFRWDGWMPGFIADDAGGWLGPYFNVFPLITVTLFLIQQKLFTPPATDEQTRTQQQMMTYMTVFMGIMFYKVPAGLCLYFITSSLWGICERKLLPKLKPPAGSAVASSLPAKSSGANGSLTASAKKQKNRK